MNTIKKYIPFYHISEKKYNLWLWIYDIIIVSIIVFLLFPFVQGIFLLIIVIFIGIYVGIKLTLRIIRLNIVKYNDPFKTASEFMRKEEEAEGEMVEEELEIRTQPPITEVVTTYE